MMTRHNRLLEQPATRVSDRGWILAAAAQQLSVRWQEHGATQKDRDRICNRVAAARL